MKIFNNTSKKILAEDAEVADTFLKQTLGLLLYKTPRVMIFKTRFGIHTFGMRFRIDVLVLDRNNKIVKLKKNLQPNRIFLWNPKYEKIIELPEDTIANTKTKIADSIAVN